MLVFDAPVRSSAAAVLARSLVKYCEVPSATSDVVSASACAIAAVCAASASALANAVVAICVVLVSAAAVGAVGTPVRSGEASGANPEMLAPAGIVTVPVNVGEARLALRSRAV